MTSPQPLHQEPFDHGPPPHEPIFNIAPVILVTIAALAAIHAVRVYLLSSQDDLSILLQYAFIPARYGDVELSTLYPLAGFISPVSYSLLHADWTHMMVNGFWMLAFGSVVATRIGWLRFVVLFVLGALGGALLHYLSNIGSISPMIGASASVSAFIGAATRFAFPEGGRFARNASNLPRQSLKQAFSNRQVLIFVAIWFGINLIVGTGLIDVDGSGSSVAWQAHIGGFLVGLLLFDLVDRAENSHQLQ